VERLDPRIDKLVPRDAKLEVLARGFEWSEGPVWLKKEKALLFSDIPPNTIYRWKEGAGVSVFMRPSGYHGPARPDIKEPGTNGLALDKQGRLLMCAHGDRRVARLDSWKAPNGSQTALAERFQGKRFNSPNDLVLHSKGALFFTDPPYGLAKGMEDPSKELGFQGVYRLDPDGKVHLVTDKLERPNGIALSPDEKILYVTNSHGPRPVIVALDVAADLSTRNERVFFDATASNEKSGRKGGFDGMKVDREGNLYATGPGGVLVIGKDGTHLGTILTGERTANCAFGEDGRSLFITSDPLLLRVRTSVKGAGY
jgi:gluconolactonase